MNDREFLCNKYHNNLTTLTQAIQKAGGSMSIFDKELTLKEFLFICATNNIELNATHNKEPEPKSEPKKGSSGVVAG